MLLRSALATLLVVTFGAARAASAQTPPSWAYPVNPPGFQPEKDDGAARHVPDSVLSITLSQSRDRFYTPDWHPGDHPPMPEVVAHGRKPDVLACGFCHRAGGPGGPENANLTGLSVEYMLTQMAAFRESTQNVRTS